MHEKKEKSKMADGGHVCQWTGFSFFFFFSSFFFFFFFLLAQLNIEGTF